MRLLAITAMTLITATSILGCVAEYPLAFDADPLARVLTVTDAQAGPVPNATSKADTQAAARRTSVSGSLSGELSFQLFSVGATRPGERWTIRPSGLLSSAFVVVLFDDQRNLLYREYVTSGSTLDHVMRTDVSDVQIGVMAPAGRSGGSFRFSVDIQPIQSVPAPRRQVVWLNFAGGRDVAVHTRSPISFGAFDGADIGQEYAGHSNKIKDTIVASMRADYAGFDIDLITSDELAEPAESHSVVHFGGGVSGLLGLADSVDNYNGDLSQVAVIYTNSFAPYWTMKLTPAEMGVMIANVASHELGHLLGLYHTQDPTGVMDTTGSAWDLAGAQAFSRGQLEVTVFATGMEDSPALLEQILGPAPFVKDGAATAKVAKIPTYREIQRLAQSEIPYTCETCLLLDPDPTSPGIE